MTVTTIQVEGVEPFSVRIFVNAALVVWQPHNPDGGAPWVSKDEAEAWADDVVQIHILSGLWPPLAY